MQWKIKNAIGEEYTIDYLFAVDRDLEMAK